MNTTRIGKIARLPEAVREELNRRLENGESGASLCTWLHARPEVQTVLAKEFAGRPINAQNLTEWRQGGFRDWQAKQETRILAKDLGHQMLSEPEAGHKVSTEILALWLTSRYAVATRRVNETADPKEHWRLLREMCSDIVRLRQGEIDLQRIELKHQWRELRTRQSEKHNVPVSTSDVHGLRSRGEQPHPGRERSPSVPTHPVASAQASERSASVPYLGSDLTAATRISPPEIPPIRPAASRVFQTDSNPFKPLRTSGTRQVPTHPVATKQASERSTSVPYPGSDLTAATRISPTKIPPIRPAASRVFQTDSNPFKPLKTSGTRQAPLTGPIGGL